MAHPVRSWTHVGVLVLLLCGRARAEALVDPPALESRNGVLQILMVARAQHLTTLPGQPVGWVYEICRYNPKDGPLRRCPAQGLGREQLLTCPAAADPPVSPYGGVRLQVDPGDTLRIRFVNCLPPVAHDRPFPGEYRFVGVGGEALLQYNPSNLHTHGLLVEPRCATPSDDSYGDWMFVLAINPANGFPPGLVGRHSCQATAAGAEPVGPGKHSAHYDVTADGVIDYRIPIPRGHPAGLYWVHPHPHGLSLNQVAAGLATPLTVGRTDYLCGAPGCARAARLSVRHLILKDTQIMPDGRLKLQQDSDFCGKSETDQPRGKGLCPGSGQRYQGGTWALTVNGQVDPEIEVARDRPEIWRILNASGNASHWLALQELETGVDLPMQVLSVDGVSLEIPRGGTLADLQAKLGSKLTAIACPPLGVPGSKPAGRLCAVRILMMPSSRVEIGVGAAGSGRAVLRTYPWNTGPDGDDWPAVELASVSLPAPTSSTPRDYVRLHGQSGSLMASGGLLSRTFPSTGGASATGKRCEHLLPEQARQIVFGETTEHLQGLGYREVMAGQPLTGPGGLELWTFDHAAEPTICVSLDQGDRPVSEVWELVNVAAEDHNFHIHQARFEVLRSETIAGGSITPERLDGARVLHDNVPVPRGGPGCDGSVAAWRAGKCVPSRVVVRIPFTIPGDFIYHCHILSHEDAGMMAKISVVPARRR